MDLEKIMKELTYNESSLSKSIVNKSCPNFTICIINTCLNKRTLRVVAMVARARQIIRLC